MKYIHTYTESFKGVKFTTPRVFLYFTPCMCIIYTLLGIDQHPLGISSLHPNGVLIKFRYTQNGVV